MNAMHVEDLYSIITTVTQMQWNINGLKHHNNELSKLQRDANFSICCIQETQLKDSDELNFPGFSFTLNDFSGELIANGGVCTLTAQKIPYSTVHVTSNFQLIAIRTFKLILETISCIYIPPSQNISVIELMNIKNQLPPPIMLL